MNKAINFIAFEIGWFACVWGAAQQMPWLGPLVLLPIAGWHLYRAGNAKAELGLMLVIVIIGSLFDQSLLSAGWIKYPASSWPAALLPLWMSTLWLLFATTLNVCLRWMRGKTLIAIAFGLIGGPLAYMGGVKLGAMQFVQPHALLIALAAGWAIFTPSMVWLSTKLDGYADGNQGSAAGTQHV